MCFMVRFRSLFWMCAIRPQYYQMNNGSGHLYVNSQCNSGVNLKKLVWPGRGWTFFILLWHGFLPVLPRARFFTPGNSFQYGILLLRSHRFRPASRRPPSLVLQNIISLFFYSVCRLFQHYAVTPDLNRDATELTLNVLRQDVETNGISLCMYC